VDDYPHHHLWSIGRCVLQARTGRAPTAKIIPSNTLMRFRKLQIAFSATCLTACVFFVVMWVRSCNDIYDEVMWPANSKMVAGIQSGPGRWFIYTRNSTSPHFWWGSPKFTSRGRSDFAPHVFRFSKSPMGLRDICLPHWLPIITTAALALVFVIPWPRWRFSLRTLLVATTLVAVVLGLIVAVLR